MLTGLAAVVAISLNWADARFSRPAPVLLPRPAVQWCAATTAAEAAEQARLQTGGRVLSVERGSGGWQVRVLTPAGEVRVVFIPGSGG
jgi:hypothetical protein